MYIPVMKNRTIEMSVLKDLINVGLSNNTIPMIEIIQERSRSNLNKDYIQEIQEIFENGKNKFLLDIPKINITGSTAEPVQKFMTRVNRQRNFCFDQIKMCINIPGIIPVLSYNNREIPSLDVLFEDMDELHNCFSKIAVRMTPTHYNKIGEDCLQRLNRDDIFILDIDDKGHMNPAFKLVYKNIHTYKKTGGFVSVILNSNRPSTMFNKNIIDGEPIEDIDNSLLEMYSMAQYKFDGFGDYACSTNTLPSTGGTISPAGIYYSKENNFFVGYKGRTPTLSEFPTYIAPEIFRSEYWNEYDEDHHIHCPGCSKIKSIIQGEESGKSQAIWKGICMNHYIYTVDQLLK